MLINDNLIQKKKKKSGCTFRVFKFSNTEYKVEKLKTQERAKKRSNGHRLSRSG